MNVKKNWSNKFLAQHPHNTRTTHTHTTPHKAPHNTLAQHKQKVFQVKHNKWFVSSWCTQFYVLFTQLIEHWTNRSINHFNSPMSKWWINWIIGHLVNQFNGFSIDQDIKPMAWGFKKPRTWRGLGQARPSLGPRNLSMASHSWSSSKN